MKITNFNNKFPELMTFRPNARLGQDLIFGKVNPEIKG